MHINRDGSSSHYHPQAARDGGVQHAVQPTPGALPRHRQLRRDSPNVGHEIDAEPGRRGEVLRQVDYHSKIP